MKLNVSSPAYVVGFALVFAGVFTAAVVTLQVLAEERIERNRTLRDERALVKAADVRKAVDEMSDDEIREVVRYQIKSGLVVTDPETGREFRVYRAYHEPRGNLRSVVFEISGNGFWAPIRGFLALRPHRRRVIRAVFTEHRETPGLGGRITEEAFQKDQFDDLDVSPPPKGKPFVYLVKGRRPQAGDPRAGRTIEANTGATQTSAAVVRFLNRDLAQFQRAMDQWEARQEVFKQMRDALEKQEIELP